MMAKCFRLFLLVSAISVIMAYADDPRAIYREIYAQITAAEAKSASGQTDQASKEFQEILFHLENFQKQFPDWEPEIVKFRVQYARNQIKQLQPKTVAAQQPAAPQASAAQTLPVEPPPTLIPTLPTSTIPASTAPSAEAPVQAPPPAPVAQQPPPPAPVAAQQVPVAPAPQQPTARPTKILPLPEPPATPPQPQKISQAAPPPAPPAPPKQVQLQPVALPATSAPAPASTLRPSPSSSKMVLSQPAIAPTPLTSLSTANLQSMAKEVESRISRLESENKALRASLAEAQSRADVSSSYVKVLTRENEFLQDKLNRELRKLEELRRILTQQFNEHSSRWNALQQRVKELITDPEIAPPQTLIVPPEGEPTYSAPAEAPSQATAPDALPQEPQPEAPQTYQAAPEESKNENPQALIESLPLS